MRAPYLWCALGLFLALLLSVVLGPVEIPPVEIARMLLSRLPFLHLERDWAPQSETILFQVRLPGTALVALTGRLSREAERPTRDSSGILSPTPSSSVSRAAPAWGRCWPWWPLGPWR